MNSQLKSTVSPIYKRFPRGRPGGPFEVNVYASRHSYKYFTPLAALQKEMTERCRSQAPSAKKFAAGLLSSIMEGYLMKPYFGGRVDPVVNVVFVNPSLDIQAISDPSLRPVAIPGVHPGRLQVPALFVDLPWHELTTDAVASAILQALRTALPREDFDKHFPMGTHSLRLMSVASDLIDAYAVGCIVVRNTHQKPSACAKKLARGVTAERPTVLRLMSMLSSSLNVAVLFATERKNEDPVELKLAIDALLLALANKSART